MKADSTRYADADLVALTNNGFRYRFSSMKLTLAGQMVEHVNYPGQATSLLGLASYSPDYSKGCGLIQGWTPDINANAAVANRITYGVGHHEGEQIECKLHSGALQHYSFCIHAWCTSSGCLKFLPKCCSWKKILEAPSNLTYLRNCRCHFNSASG